MFCDECKDQAEAIKSDYDEQLGKERNNVAAAHEILNKAGIPPAAGAACDDPKCFSHLTHRTHTLVEGRDSLLLQVDALTQQTKDEASAYSSLAKSYEAMKLQISELKAHSERVGAVNQVRWDDYVKATNRADAAERLNGEYKAALEEIAHPPSRNGHWSEKVAEEALADKQNSENVGAICDGCKCRFVTAKGDDDGNYCVNCIETKNRNEPSQEIIHCGESFHGCDIGQPVCVCRCAACLQMRG